jgi:hypothetical protein
MPKLELNERERAVLAPLLARVQAGEQAKVQLNTVVLIIIERAGLDPLKAWSLSPDLSSVEGVDDGVAQ